MYLNQGQLSSGGNKLLPETTNLTSWLASPTTDGKTLSNVMGTDATLTGINTLNFDGTNDFVDFANGGGVIPDGSAFEIEVTAKLVVDQPTDGSDATHLFFQGTYGSSTGVIQCSIRGGSTYNGILFRLGNGSGGYNQLTPDSDQTSTVNDNEFHIYKFTFDGSDTMKIFLDGALVGTKTSLTNPTFSNTSQNNIGLDAASGYGVQMRVSNHITRVNGSLFRQLPIQEGSGTKCYDISGNGYYAEITGATWVTENNIASHNALYGHDLVGVLNGTVSGFDTGLDGDELDMYEIKMQSTGDAGGVGDGNSFFVEASHFNPSLFMTSTTEGSGLRMSLRLAGKSASDTPPNGIEFLTGVSSADFNVYKVDYTDTSSVKVYVNGELKLTSTQTVTPSNAHWHIGNDNPTNASDNGFFYYFKGWKDGVLKIYAVVDVDGRVKDLVSGNLLTADQGGTGSLGVRRFPSLINKTTQVVTLDGVNDGIDTNYNPAQDLVIDCRVRLNSFSGDTVIHGTSSSGYYFGVNNGEWQLKAGGVFIFTGAADHSPDSTTLIFDTRLEFVDSTSTWTAYAKDSTQTEYTLLGTGTATPNFIEANVLLGKLASSKYFDGEIHSFKLTSNGVTKIEYDFSPTGTSTILDISGNQNGTASNITTDLFWGKRITDSNGSIVSADYANGNTNIRNSSGLLHNQSEVGFDLVTTDKTSSNIFAVDNANETDDFAKKDSNGNVTQYLQYSSPISDSTSLTRTRTYVG
tara:strand:- start:28 stop:2268 length:2241 start_codon:yes stop_codon:yes gene_type:complete